MVWTPAGIELWEGGFAGRGVKSIQFAGGEMERQRSQVAQADHIETWRKAELNGRRLDLETSTVAR